MRNGVFSLVFPPGILTSMVCTERIFLVLLIIGSCAAPEVSILPPFGRAGVESPAIVGEREDARLSVGVATVSLGYSYKHNQKGLSKHSCTCLPLLFLIFSLTEADLVSSKGGKILWIWPAISIDQIILLSKYLTQKATCFLWVEQHLSSSSDIHCYHLSRHACFPFAKLSGWPKSSCGFFSKVL